MLTQDLMQFHGKLYATSKSQSLLQQLIREIAWQQDFIAYGRRFNVPRMQAWHADPGVHYRYADNKLASHTWTPLLLAIKQDVENQSGYDFNSVLLTYYRDGRDHVNWHADDEAELGEAPVIASLSLGATREFQYRKTRGNERGSLQLQDGELLVMRPLFQQQWQHRVPVQAHIQGQRINLTFRRVLSRQGH